MKTAILTLFAAVALHAAPIQITPANETDFFLPEDGAPAKAALLARVQQGNEIWIDAYAFDDHALLSALEARDAAGAPIHVLLDHLQSTGSTEKPLLAQFIRTVHHADVTITTAGVGSPKTSEIWHWKAVVVRDRAGAFHCWEGSVNFSDNGWWQGNSARAFDSKPWAQAFIAQFTAHRAWALTNHAQWQVQAPTKVGGGSSQAPAHRGGGDTAEPR
jgi:hypothetical protein